LDIPILSAHALNTSTNTNINHAAANSVRNINNSHQATGTLPVQALDRGGRWESGCKSCTTELGGATTWCKHTPDGNIFDEGGIDLGALDECLEGTVEEVSTGCVFETTLSTLGEGGTEGACYDDLGTLLGLCGQILQS
jgi:hypothetical protein